MSGGLSGSDSVSFYKPTVEGNAVCWSKDERIAVAASDAVYVLTLKRPSQSEAKAVKDESTSITLSSAHLGNHPHVAVTLATAPLRDSLPPLTATKSLPRTTLEQCSLQGGVDPVMSDKGVDLLRGVQWSPVGCSVPGGCVLTVVTESGRVLLYMPPASTSLKWKLIDLSTHLSDVFHPRGNDKETPTSTNGEVQQTNGSKKPSTAKDHSSKKSKKATKGSKAASKEQSDASLTEGPRPKRAKLSAMMYKDTAEDPAAVERLGAAVATCAWLPTLLATPGGGVVGVIAMATKSGHVALVGVKLPVSEKTGCDRENYFLIGQHKVSLKSSKSTRTEEGWCSSLLWLPTPASSPPLPPSGSLSPPSYISSSDGSTPRCSHLMVGCTGGQVACLRLSWRGVMPGSNDDAGCYGNQITVVKCAGDAAELVTASVENALPIWAESDSIPVQCMACHSRFSKDGLWVVWAKSTIVIATRLSSSYDPVGKQVQISGLHKMMVSGISSLSPNVFVSSSLEGTVQTFSLDPASTTAVPSAVAMEMSPEKGAISHGLAASESGLLVAVAMNIPGDFLKVSSSKGKFAVFSKVCFKVLASERQVEELIKNHPSGRWDVCEYLRRYYAERRVMPPQIKELWTTLIKGRSIPFPKLWLLLYAYIIMGKKEEVSRLRKEIMKRHVIQSLRSWGEIEKKKDSKKGSNSKSKDKEKDSNGISDSLSSVSLQIMAGWILSVSNNMCVTDNRLAKKILEDLPSKSDKVTSKEAQILELCPACGDPVPITNHEYDLCSRGHRWGRCGLTMMLAADSHCGSCLQCGAIANNLSTVSSPPGSWLHKLLSQHSCCIFCGGFFERVV